jgi:hypothetical protein
MAWLPCVRLTVAGRKLCQRHEDSVAGVMLGIFVAGCADERAKRPRPKFRKRVKGRAPGLDMRFKASRDFAKLDQFYR